MIQNKTKYAILAFAVAMLCASCAELDLCEDQHDELPTVQYSFNWSNNEDYMPEQMYVMAHRIVNDWKRVDILPAREASEAVDIRPGEYSFVALPTEHNAFDLTEMVRSLSQHMIYGYEDYRYDESGGSVKDIVLSYKLQNAANGSYIPGDAGPFYYDFVDVVKHYDGTANVKFAPKPLTQCIDIEFSVLMNTENQLEQIEAELSGVPVSMQIGNGYISPDKTASVILPVESVGKTVEMPDGSTRTLWKFTARIHVPTVINSESVSAEDGPGILTLTAITSDKSGNGTKYTTVLKRNLYNILDKAKLYVYTDDDEHVIKNCDNAKLLIEMPFTINK